jgi:hypothetical protein
MSQTKTFKITPTCFDHLMIETCWSDFKIIFVCDILINVLIQTNALVVSLYIV